LEAEAEAGAAAETVAVSRKAAVAVVVSVRLLQTLLAAVDLLVAEALARIQPLVAAALDSL
jgi:hypothetical protein